MKGLFLPGLYTALFDDNEAPLQMKRAVKLSDELSKLWMPLKLIAEEDQITQRHWQFRCNFNFGQFEDEYFMALNFSSCG